MEQEAKELEDKLRMDFKSDNFEDKESIESEHTEKNKLIEDDDVDRN